MENIIAANLNYEQLLQQLNNYKQVLDSLIKDEEPSHPEPVYTVSTPPTQIKLDPEPEPQYSHELETPVKTMRSVTAKRQKLQNGFKIKKVKTLKTKKHQS